MEVIIATSLFFMVSLFLLTLLPGAQWAGRKADNRYFAESLIDAEMERLRGLPFSSLTPGPLTDTTSKANGVTFVVHTEISDIPGSDPDLLKEAKVVVMWTEREQDLKVEDSAYIPKVRP